MFMYQYRNRIALFFCTLLFACLIPIEIGNAQTPSNPPAITLDGAVEPSIANTGDQVVVTLTLVKGNMECEAVEIKRPLDIVLVLDRSASMDEALGEGFQGSKIQGATEAIDNFLNLVDPANDRVGLVIYSSDVATLASLTMPSQVRSVLPTLPAGFNSGGTNIGAGLSNALELVAKGQRSSASPLVVVLSDGNENEGSARPVASALRQSNIRVLSIGLGPNVDDNLMRDIATQPSDYYYAPDTGNLKGIYEAIAKSIQQYDPATDIKVKYTFNASNFDLVQDSIQPAAEVNLNTITWSFDRIENDRQVMQVALISKVSGKQNAAINTELTYTQCGKTPVSITPVANYMVDVVEKSPVSNIACGDSLQKPTGFLSTICQDFPYGILVGFIVAILLFLLWLWRNWSEIRAWWRCDQPLRACTWSKLALSLWTAVTIGALVSLLLSYFCSVRSGVMFWRILPDRTSAIYLLPTDPILDVRPLTKMETDGNCIGCHAASSASQSIIAVASATNGKLLRLDFNGYPVNVPDLQGSYPAISPDGKLVAFAANNQDIFIYNLQTGTSQSLKGASDPSVIESMPAWSADGQKIAFVRASGIGQETTITAPSDIMVVPSQGGAPLLMSGASTFGYNYHPAFSPDGKWLAFTHHENGTTTYGDTKAEIYLVPAEGGTARRIQANNGPGGQELVDAGNTWPTWSADGKTLYFSSRRCDKQYDLFSTQIDSAGNSTPATRIAEISDPKAYEYHAQEVNFRIEPATVWLMKSLPWLLPLFLLGLLTAWLCRPSGKAKKTPTITVHPPVAEPPKGMLLPDQKFKVQIEMVGNPVDEQRTINREVDAVILIDTSSSMSEAIGKSGTRIDAAKKAAKKFVQCGISSRDRIGLISFSDGANTLNGLTTHEADLLLAIKKLSPEGSTSMKAGLEKAYELLFEQGRTKTSKVIILLSDGEPTDPSEEVISVARKIHDQGIHIIAVGIGEANAELLTEIAPNDYRSAGDTRSLINIFLQKAKEIKKPIAATDLLFTHYYDAKNFELVPGSVNPDARVNLGILTWELGELDNHPVVFEYVMRPIAEGNFDIALSGSSVRYTRCGIGPKIDQPVPAGAHVQVDRIDVADDIPLRDLKPPVKLEAIKPVWQPDKALFIGIGGSGKWILTYLLSNMLNAGGGQIPVDKDGNHLIRFLSIDTNEHETLEQVSFAGIRVPPEDVFILDENLGSAIDALASKDSLIPSEFQDWFVPKLYQGLSGQLNMANGSFKRRPIAKLALLRNLTGAQDIQSTWLETQNKKNKSAILKDWIEQRCNEVLRKDQLTRVRIFIVGSLAGGLSGILNDVSVLAQQVGTQIAGDKGGVRIEGYFVDGAAYSGLYGNTDTGKQLQANNFVSLRELSRFQLNPGYPYEVGWNGVKVEAPLFDDLLIFSQNHDPSVIGQQGNTNTQDVARHILTDYVYPSIADILSIRIDKATGAAGPNDWFNHMQRVRTDRQKQEKQLVTGSAGVFSIRVPVQDILRSLQVRWAYELLRMFLTAEVEEKYVASDAVESIAFDFNSQSIGTDIYNQDPQQMVKRYLLGGRFGGEGSPATRALFDFLREGASPLAGSQELLDDLNRDEQYLYQDQYKRLGKSIELVLIGRFEGARSQRIAYVVQFLNAVQDRLLPLSKKLKDEWEQPELARFAEVCVRAAQVQLKDMDRLCRLISQNNTGQPDGIWERIFRLASRMGNIESEMNRISCRKYLWGIPSQDTGQAVQISRFADKWWLEYFAGRAADYLDALSWVADSNGTIDLIVRIEGRPCSLVNDGPEAVLHALVDIGASLCPKHELLSLNLPDIIERYKLLTPQMGSQFGTISTPICSMSTDLNPSPDSLIFISPNSNTSPLENAQGFVTAFSIAASQQLALSTSSYNSTEPMWYAFLHLRNGVRVDTWNSYHLARTACDQVDGVNQQSHATNNAFTRAVYKCEALARSLELSSHYNYRQGGPLHPTIVAALEYPHRTELFCLALAEGLISLNSGKEMVLQLPGKNSLTLAAGQNYLIDPYINALLNWVYRRPVTIAWQSWEDVLHERYQQKKFNETALLSWYRSPNPEFGTDGSVRTSLGFLTNSVIKHLGDVNRYMWE